MIDYAAGGSTIFVRPRADIGVEFDESAIDFLFVLGVCTDFSM